MSPPVFWCVGFCVHAFTYWRLWALGSLRAEPLSVAGFPPIGKAGAQHWRPLLLCGSGRHARPPVLCLVCTRGPICQRLNCSPWSAALCFSSLGRAPRCSSSTASCLCGHSCREQDSAVTCHRACMHAVASAVTAPSRGQQVPGVTHVQTCTCSLGRC